MKARASSMVTSTPDARRFLRAIGNRWGAITWDAAALHLPRRRTFSPHCPWSEDQPSAAAPARKSAHRPIAFIRERALSASRPRRSRGQRTDHCSGRTQIGHRASSRGQPSPVTDPRSIPPSLGEKISELCRRTSSPNSPPRAPGNTPRLSGTSSPDRRHYRASR
ncbi:MAG: hypothetical protein ACI8T1_000177 [Verrucomicrobiales bacterium]|jgi:hypothetical protein